MNRKLGWTLFAFIIMAFVLMTASIFDTTVLGVKKTVSSSSSSVKTLHKITNKTATATTTAHHVKGVKVSRVHTVPSKVVVGSTFGLRGIVFNNSTATITFANGTCTSPLSITFNKNVITEPQARTGSCKSQQVTLRPGQQSPILSPNLSGIIYRATAPGITNVSMTFKYGIETATSKTPVSDSISRFFAFSILPGTRQISAASASSTPTAGTTLEPGPLKLPIP
jgi:hypothetical protein